MLDLLAVIGGASVVALLGSSEALEAQNLQVPLVVVAGIIGGVWLYWWRDH